MSEFDDNYCNHENDCNKDSNLDYETFKTWEDKNLNLKLDLLRGIYSYGFENPSPIQQKAIISMIKGNDIIAQAQSGTGKTGAFSIGALQVVDNTNDSTQVYFYLQQENLQLKVIM